MQPLSILFGAGFTVAVGCSCGAGGPAMRFVAGSAILSALVFAAGALHLAHPPVFGVLGAIPIAAARSEFSEPHFTRLPRRWLIFVPFAVPYLANGEKNRAFGRHSAVAVVHLGFLVALTAPVFTWVRSEGGEVAGFAAAFLVFASPLVGVDGTSTAIGFTLFRVLEIWDEQRWVRMLIAAGLLAGFAFSAKYTAFLAIPYSAGLVLWRSRPLGWALAAAGVVVAPLFKRYFLKVYVSRCFEAEYLDDAVRRRRPVQHTRGFVLRQIRHDRSCRDEAGSGLQRLTARPFEHLGGSAPPSLAATRLGLAARRDTGIRPSPPPDNLRRRTTDELRRRGIDTVEVGVTEVTHSKGARLYKLA